jgi:hypothetical protein
VRGRLDKTKVLPKKIVDMLGPETKDYATEDIIESGYCLQLVGEWDSLPASEVNDVKKFMKDISPFLATLVGEAHTLLKLLRKKKQVSEHQIDKILGPGVYFSRMVDDDVVYHIRLTWDNVVFLDREEGIWVKTEEYAKPGEKVAPGGRSFSSFHVVRQVGEIHPVAADV